MDTRPIAIYRTDNWIRIDDLYDRLGCGIIGKDHHHSLWHFLPPPRLPNVYPHTGVSTFTVASIVNRHHTHQTLNQQLFVIIDQHDQPLRDVLTVNLACSSSPHLPDVLRQNVHLALDFVPSVIAGNTSWWEGLANATLPLYPRGKFAVFAHEDFHPRYLVGEALQKMNAGVGGRRKGTRTVFAEWEPGEGKGNIAWWWRQNNIEMYWDDRACVILRKKTWERGRVASFIESNGWQGNGKVVEVETEIVGDLLVWLFVGLVEQRDVIRWGREGAKEGLKGLLSHAENPKEDN